MNLLLKPWHLFQIPTFSDDRGILSVIESSSSFLIRRVFYQYNFPLSSTRGNHANKYSEFIFVVLKGQMEIILDDGNQTQKYLLNSPSQGLYTSKYVWKKMAHFSSDCILLILSNKKYDLNDYINSYDLFKTIVKNRKVLRLTKQ
jgi:hypothetical protein